MVPLFRKIKRLFPELMGQKSQPGLRRVRQQDHLILSLITESFCSSSFSSQIMSPWGPRYQFPSINIEYIKVFFKMFFLLTYYVGRSWGTMYIIHCISICIKVIKVSMKCFKSFFPSAWKARKLLHLIGF